MMISHTRGNSAYIVVFVCLWISSPINEAQAVPGLPTAGWTFDGNGSTELPTFGSLNANLENGLDRDDDAPFEYAGNQSLLMDELNEFVNIDTPNLLSEVSSFTFSVWVKPTELGRDPVCTDCTALLADSERGGFFFEIQEESSLEFHTPSPADKSAITGPNLVPLNTWTHLAIVKDGSNNLVYVNGTQEASVADDLSLPALTGNLRLGKWKFDALTSSDFRGWMDEAAFWDVALQEADIKYLSQHSITAIPEPSTALLACLGFLSVLVGSTRRRM